MRVRYWVIGVVIYITGLLGFIAVPAVDLTLLTTSTPHLSSSDLNKDNLNAPVPLRVYHWGLERPVLAGLVNAVTVGVYTVTPQQRDYIGDGVAYPEAFMSHLQHHNQFAFRLGQALGWLWITLIVLVLYKWIMALTIRGNALFHTPVSNALSEAHDNRNTGSN